MLGSGKSHVRVPGRSPWPLILCSIVTAQALPARCESTISASTLAAADNQRFRWQEAQASWAHEGDISGERLMIRGHHYALEAPFAGIRAFDGREGAAEGGAHLLAGLWWFEGAAGFQGVADWHDAVGRFVLARAFPTSGGTFTPRLDVGRGPLALYPVPLSLGMFSDRAEAALAWRASRWSARSAITSSCGRRPPPPAAWRTQRSTRSQATAFSRCRAMC